MEGISKSVQVPALEAILAVAILAFLLIVFIMLISIRSDGKLKGGKEADGAIYDEAFDDEESRLWKNRRPSGEETPIIPAFDAQTDEIAEAAAAIGEEQLNKENDAKSDFSQITLADIPDFELADLDGAEEEASQPAAPEPAFKDEQTLPDKPEKESDEVSPDLTGEENAPEYEKAPQPAEEQFDSTPEEWKLDDNEELDDLQSSYSQLQPDDTKFDSAERLEQAFSEAVSASGESISDDALNSAQPEAFEAQQTSEEDIYAEHEPELEQEVEAAGEIEEPVSGQTADAASDEIPEYTADEIGDSIPEIELPVDLSVLTEENEIIPPQGTELPEPAVDETEDKTGQSEEKAGAFSLDALNGIDFGDDSLDIISMLSGEGWSFLGEDTENTPDRDPEDAPTFDDVQLNFIHPGDLIVENGALAPASQPEEAAPVSPEIASEIKEASGAIDDTAAEDLYETAKEAAEVIDEVSAETEPEQVFDVPGGDGIKAPAKAGDAAKEAPDILSPADPSIQETAIPEADAFIDQHIDFEVSDIPMPIEGDIESAVLGEQSRFGFGQQSPKSEDVTESLIFRIFNSSLETGSGNPDKDVIESVELEPSMDNYLPPDDIR